MKKLIYMVSLMTLGIFLMFLYGGCESSTDPATTVATTVATTIATTVPVNATITGVGSLPPGVGGSIGNTRVALYISEADFWADATFKFGPTDANGNYTLSPVVPGTYYMDAWKDNDNSGNWTIGDYFWWNGSGAYPAAITLAPLQFTAGANTKDFQVIVL